MPSRPPRRARGRERQILRRPLTVNRTAPNGVIVGFKGVACFCPGQCGTLCVSELFTLWSYKPCLAEIEHMDRFPLPAPASLRYSPSVRVHVQIRRRAHSDRPPVRRLRVARPRVRRLRVDHLLIRNLRASHFLECAAVPWARNSISARRLGTCLLCG
jgi:hypothetical protein